MTKVAAYQTRAFYPLSVIICKTSSSSKISFQMHLAQKSLLNFFEAIEHAQYHLFLMNQKLEIKYRDFFLILTSYTFLIRRHRFLLRTLINVCILKKLNLKFAVKFVNPNFIWNNIITSMDLFNQMHGFVMFVVWSILTSQQIFKSIQER